MFFVEIGKKTELELRNLKLPELENWELEVPGTWKLQNLGTSELGNFGTWELVLRYPERIKDL